MTEKSPQETREPSDKVVCPLASTFSSDSQILRRQDLSKLGTTFSESLTPLKEILDHMRGLNARYTASSRQLRRVTWFQVVISLVSMASLLVLVVSLNFMWRALTMLESHTDTLGQLEKDVTKQTQELNKVKRAAQQTEKRVAKAEEKQESEPTLELVPETDPVKARRAPVKLRVKAPVNPHPVPEASRPADSAAVSSKQAPTTMAEIPLPAESF